VKSIIAHPTGNITRYSVYGAGGELIYIVQIDQTDAAPKDHYVMTHVAMDGQTLARVKSKGVGTPYPY